MLINTDYIEPAELTGYVRAGLADLPANRFRLAQWLPNNPIDDLEYRFTRGGEPLIEAATFRAYDAESGIGSRPGFARVTGELPPVSRKVRLGEYDRLRQRRLDGAIRNQIMTDAMRMTRAVAARMEIARGQALYAGVVTINENGIQATVDFGRSGSHTVAPGTLWSNTATATPLANLLAWRDTYIATNGESPAAILTSNTVLGYLLLNAEIRGLLAANGVTPNRVTPAAVNDLLSAHGLPPIETYDAMVRAEQANGTVASQRIIPADRLLFLPEPGDPNDPESTDLGATLWGTTAESLEPEYAVEDGEEPGVVAGAYSTKDPVAIWTKAAGIALPVVANPDLTLAADVA